MLANPLEGVLTLLIAASALYIFVVWIIASTTHQNEEDERGVSPLEVGAGIHVGLFILFSACVLKAFF